MEVWYIIGTELHNKDATQLSMISHRMRDTLNKMLFAIVRFNPTYNQHATMKRSFVLLSRSRAQGTDTDLQAIVQSGYSTSSVPHICIHLCKRSGSKTG